MQKVNLGVIGCGGRGRLYSELSSHISELHIRAFADIKEKAAKYCCEKYGGKYYTSKVDKVFNDPRIDGVIIATWHDTHTDYAIRAAQAGKHILIEKPLALTVEECDKIGEAVQKAGVKLMICFKMRFMPMVRKVRELIRNPILLVGQMMDSRWSDESWSQRPITGGGNVKSQGPHTVDLLCYLAGSDPEVVYSEGGDITHKGSGIIDNIVGTIKFNNGIVASVIQGDGGLSKFTSKFFIEVFAEDKGATLYNRCHDVMFWGIRPQHLSAETYSEESKADPEGDIGLLKAFVASILDDRAPSPGWKEGRTATAIINGFFEAIKTGKSQRIA